MLVNGYITKKLILMVFWHKTENEAEERSPHSKYSIRGVEIDKKTAKIILPSLRELMWEEWLERLGLSILEEKRKKSDCGVWNHEGNGNNWHKHEQCLWGNTR